MNDLQEFVQVFGNRFPGLHDPGNTVYQTYRVPYPEAPYPQDYLIDQDGRIAYWSDEYDPQEMIRIMDNLLGYTSVEENSPGISPSSFNIISAYPNPFNASLKVEVYLQGIRETRLAIFNLLGEEIGRLYQGNELSGRHTFTFNAGEYPSGIYFVSLQNGESFQTRKVVLLK